jgi:hypothetical protein
LGENDIPRLEAFLRRVLKELRQISRLKRNIEGVDIKATKERNDEGLRDSGPKRVAMSRLISHQPFSHQRSHEALYGLSVSADDVLVTLKTGRLQTLTANRNHPFDSPARSHLVLRGYD